MPYVIPSLKQRSLRLAQMLCKGYTVRAAEMAQSSGNQSLVQFRTVEALLNVKVRNQEAFGRGDGDVYWSKVHSISPRVAQSEICLITGRNPDVGDSLLLPRYS